MTDTPELPLCPSCSIFARRHPELLGNDLIRRPTLKIRAHGVYLINYCRHSQPLFGPHPSAEAAAAAWTAVVSDLEQELSDEKRADIAAYEARLAQFEAQAAEFQDRLL